MINDIKVESGANKVFVDIKFETTLSKTSEIIMVIGIICYLFLLKQ